MATLELSFDWSGGITQTNPGDSRTAAGTLFLQKNAVPDEVGHGYFLGAKGPLDYFIAPGLSVRFMSTLDASVR